MTEQVCPGRCNAGYRKVKALYDQAVADWHAAEQDFPRRLAEWRQAAAELGDEAAGPPPAHIDRPEPPNARPWYGEPVWCRRCTATIRRCLAELDDLMALRIMSSDGYQVPGAPLAERVKKSQGDPSPSPGHDDLDELVEWLRSWEAVYRDARGWTTVPYRGKAAPALTEGVAWLLAHLDGILAYPDHAEPFGQGVVMQHARLQLTTRTRPPLQHKPLPCPRCKHRSLFLHDDETIRCSRSDECGKIMTAREYAELEDEAAREIA